MRLVELDGKAFEAIPVATYRAPVDPFPRKAARQSAGPMTWHRRSLLGMFQEP